MYYNFLILLHDPAADLQDEIQGKSWDVEQTTDGWKISGSVDTRNLSPHAAADRLSKRFPSVLIELEDEMWFEEYHYLTRWHLRNGERQVWEDSIAVADDPQGDPDRGNQIVRHVYVENGKEVDPARHEILDSIPWDDDGSADFDFAGAWGTAIEPEDRYALTEQDERNLKYHEEQQILNLFESNRSRIRPKYKTTIVIWTDYDPSEVELEDLARDATSGEAICSKQQVEKIDDPDSDPDYEVGEFFDPT
jgi:hypothetical protein